jgi:hypothetical protein
MTSSARPRIVWRHVWAIRRPRGPFFLDLGEQPGLGRGGRPVLLRKVVGKAAGLENDGNGDSNEFAVDSSLEGTGFEPSVPRQQSGRCQVPGIRPGSVD